MAGEASPGAIGDPGRAALVTWLVVELCVAGLLRIHVTLAWIGDLGSALVAVLFLYAPVVVAWRRREDLDDYGFHASPIGKGLATAGAAMAVIFPLFAVGFIAFYEVACQSSWLVHALPAGTCGGYGGLGAIHAPAVSWSFAEFCVVQLVVVALPEELFFRGFLLKLLEDRFPPKRRVLGGGIGLALVLSSAAFALIHLPKGADPRDLATFFPGLLFGWMRSATGSILAGTIAHGGSNILVRLLSLVILR